MKKIIDGITYDTEAAEKIGHYDNGLPQSDFYYIDVDMYRTADGKVFIAGEGGRLNLGRMASGRGYFRYNEGLVPLTEEESREWAQYLNYKEKEMKVSISLKVKAVTEFVVLHGMMDRLLNSHRGSRHLRMRKKAVTR